MFAESLQRRHVVQHGEHVSLVVHVTLKCRPIKSGAPYLSKS
jgi:hypothetical protein